MGVEAVFFDYGNTIVTMDFEVLATLSNTTVTAAELAVVDGPARLLLDRHLALSFARRADPGTLRFLLRALFTLAGHELTDRAIEAVVSENRRLSLWRVPNLTALATVRAIVARGVRVAVISNGDGRVESDMCDLGLRDDFEFVIDSRVVGVSKPSPAIFELAVARIGTNSEAALYVGDLPEIDVIGAAAAGLRPVLYDPHCVFSADLPRLCERTGCEVERIGRFGDVLDLVH